LGQNEARSRRHYATGKIMLRCKTCVLRRCCVPTDCIKILRYIRTMHVFHTIYCLLQHEKPTDEKLTKKQFNQVQSLIEKMDELTEMISNRVVENLRRKNEALKQASRRKGSDASAYISPSVSPCCLNDDHISLRLLVKLGKSQEAATAYSVRRSLLLQER